jgi:hypothetical protein
MKSIDAFEGSFRSFRPETLKGIAETETDEAENDPCQKQCS